MAQTIAPQKGAVVAYSAKACVWTSAAVLRAEIASEGCKVLKCS